MCQSKITIMSVVISSWIIANLLLLESPYQKLKSATMFLNPIRSPAHCNTSTTLHPTIDARPSIYLSHCLPLSLFLSIFPCSTSFSTPSSSMHDPQNSVVSWPMVVSRLLFIFTTCSTFLFKSFLTHDIFIITIKIDEGI